MHRYECLEILQQLKLSAMAECWDEIVVDGIRRKRSTMDILGSLLKAEQTHRHARSIQYRIQQARFPHYKTMAEFAFDKNALDQNVLELFADGEYLRQKKNLIFVGGLGTGKTHLATALGIQAATAGFKVRFWNVLELVNKVGARQRQHKLHWLMP